MSRIIINAGTVTLAGSTALVGSGTAWDTDGIKKGDLFRDTLTGVTALIESVTDATNIVLSSSWPGTTGSGRSYEILSLSDLTGVNDLYERVKTLIDTLGSGVAGAGTVVGDNIVAFSGSSGNSIKDSGITKAGLEAIVGDARFIKIHYAEANPDYNITSTSEVDMSDAVTFTPVDKDNSEYIVLTMTRMYVENSNNADDFRALVSVKYYDTVAAAWNTIANANEGALNVSPHSSANPRLYNNLFILDKRGTEIVKYNDPPTEIHLRMRGKCDFSNNLVNTSYTYFFLIEFKQ